MKTPDEIKKGLRCRVEPCGDKECSECEFFVDDYTEHECNADALALTLKLERERDAAIADLTTVCETVNTCLACDHYRADWERPGCELNGLHCAWKWRGIQLEAPKEV